MSDDQVALFAAEHLSQAPWWTLPASAHLRLLNVLCYDVAQVCCLSHGVLVSGLQGVLTWRADLSMHIESMGFGVVTGHGAVPAVRSGVV